MTKFIVHLYREMKLSYADIEADTPQAAAEMVSQKLTTDADNVEDCEGQNLSALVDVAGDEDYSQSVTIDFEPERIRNAASRLLATLEKCAALLADYDDDPGEEGETYRDAITAIAEATAAGITPAPATARFDFTYDPQENPDRAYVMVDGKYDVSLKRTAEGIIIDVYPKDWIDPIDSLTVWDDDVAKASAEAETDDAGEQ